MTLQNARPVRSYVLRQGRMTDAQKQAISGHWADMGLTVPSAPDTFDWSAIFGRTAPRVLEIGFGMGDTLVTLAAQNPDTDFIGIEVHQPGVGACISKAKALGLSNIRVISHDAYQVLASAIPVGSIDKVLLLFPDPWPKVRHHKRRLVQPAFMALVARVLSPQGIFHCATDWEPYAEHIAAVLAAQPAFRHAPEHYARPETKFERRGQKLGHAISDLVYIREND